jgi:hypothetical protein
MFSFHADFITELTSINTTLLMVCTQGSEGLHHKNLKLAFQLVKTWLAI